MTPLVLPLADLSRGQLVLRLLVLLGPVVAVLAAGPAGHWPPWWLLAAVLASSAGFAALPESPVGAGTMLLVVVWWAAGLDDGLHPMVLVAAAALLVTHVAATLASYGPPEMPLDADLARLWSARAVLLAVPVPLLWAAARGLRGDPQQPGIWVLGVAATLAATVAASIVLLTDDNGVAPTPATTEER